MVLAANPKDFRGPPVLKKVTARFMPDVSSREFGLQTGELDIIECLKEDKWIEKVSTFKDVKAMTFGPCETQVLFFNMSMPPFNDLRVRKAFSYALSRDVIANFMGKSGGDEFTVILSEIEDASNVERIASNILKKLAEPYRLENEVVHLSASIGITLYPHDASEIEDLLKDADQAMYEAKSMGRNRLSYFTPALQQAAISRLKLINDLRTAVSTNQLRVYFQPIVNLATGEIDKAEALIRWQHPERGMVSPMDFIPLAEETGLIIPIGEWVLRTACAQIKAWHDAGYPALQVAVNLSSKQLRDKRLIWVVRQSLDAAGLEPRYLD